MTTDADGALSIDPDSGTSIVTNRPLYRRPAALLAVFLGGVIGTGLREGISLLIPAVGGVPVGILVINLSGAFILGLLLGVLSRLGPDDGWRRTLRLFGGTGVLGGYTTYSALAVDSAHLIVLGSPIVALAYALGSVVLGVSAAALGLWAGEAWGTHRRAAQ